MSYTKSEMQEIVRKADNSRRLRDQGDKLVMEAMQEAQEWIKDNMDTIGSESPREKAERLEDCAVMMGVSRGLAVNLAPYRDHIKALLAAGVDEIKMNPDAPVGVTGREEMIEVMASVLSETTVAKAVEILINKLNSLEK